jgi:small subunit ribosomal protein S20
MANIKSALKRIRQNEKRRARNAAIRSSVRGAVKTARTALAEGSADAKAAVSRTIQTLDKAVTKGVVHKNAAARKKSRLARQLNALASPPGPAR